MTRSKHVTVFAGIPAVNKTLYHKLRFTVMDPVAVIYVPGADGSTVSTLIVRDIEMARARQRARVDHVHCPADFPPTGGLSGDRETATAQSLAEFLSRAGIEKVVADRTLPLIFAHVLQQAGIGVACDPELGVADRRSKDAEEIAQLREAQKTTEDAIRLACGMIATADADKDGALSLDGEPLTSERVRSAVDVFLTERGYDSPTAIISGGPSGADCHNVGHGRLRTGEPVIIDIFPSNRATMYNGDCTRTVVHGAVSDQLATMRDAVAAAKAAAIAAVKPGVTGEAVHAETARVLKEHGFDVIRPGDVDTGALCAMVHGTGHGVGLDVHEPPLLDTGGPPLVVGDILTIEPGLYGESIGGVRIEDMVVVTEDGCDNFNELPEGLSWS